MTPKPCARCGKCFTPLRANALYCCGACKVAAHRARTPKRQAERTCAHCHAPLSAQGKRRYCSDACRQAAYRARQDGDR